MSNVNKRWDKWVFASLSKFFYDAAVLEDKEMFIEGQKQDTNKFPEWLEFRMEGPWFSELSKDCWHIEVVVDIGVNRSKDDTNFHGLSLLKGVTESLFESCIPVYKYPTEGIVDPESDSSLFVALSLQNMDTRTPLKAKVYGQPSPSTELEQATVEGIYTQTFSLTP